MNHELDDMYRDVILDHYRFPRGRKPIPRADLTSDGMNPSCGDEISLRVALDAGSVRDIHVDCRGCAISVASASMLAEIAKGKSLTELKQLAAGVRAMLKGEPCSLPATIGDLDALQGVKKFPVRVKCALLAWVTFIHGIEEYEHGKASSSPVSTEDSL